MQIASGGFGAAPGSTLYAFRPLYPLILRLLYPLFGWLDVASAEVMGGFVWNLFATVMAAVYLERLTGLLLGPRIAGRTLLLLAVFPSTLFLTVIYPEATCILLVAAALYYLESSKILLAGGLGFLAGLVRPEAFLLAIPFLVKALSEGQRLKKVIAGLTTLLSLPAFGLFSYLETGNLFAALQAERGWPKCPILCVAGNPSVQPGTLSNLFAQPETLSYIINSATMVLAVLPVAYSLLARKASSKTFPYYLWSLVVLATFLYAGEIKSWARYALVLPPVFWAQAEYSLNHSKFFQAQVILYTVMMSLATVLYVNWYPML